ncbi:hypothetical protein CYMTET_43418 [Cymbomonas tetramitiformis]|uniref:Reverse transcriptase domain-containing protein n=1 Tax=Cymbomonas tetramitiformis TaxID=36881 RepID=A0AAE0F1N9_9CHLO|nr:hypothetical protein CYMTET_43418 [Cymbomonas tetramitiformis]
MSAPAQRDPGWASWDTQEVRQVLESLRDLVVGSNVLKTDWEAARFDVLAGFAAIAGPLRTVPQEVLEATRELTEIGLLEEGAGAGPSPTFAVVSEWVLRGNWTSARAIAKKRMKAVKAWGTTMLATLAASPAPAGGAGALGLGVGGGAPGGSAGGPTGTVILTHAELMELLDQAVAKAAAAAGGALGAPAGGASASGVEGQYRRALAASQGKRDGWSVDRHKQVRAGVLAEGAKLREPLLRFCSEHPWKRPGTALEAHSFPELTWARPMLEEEACDIDELPAGEEASLEDWCVLVHLLRVRVTEMQDFVKGKEPGTIFEDVLDDTFARKRQRSPSPPAMAKRAQVDPGVSAGVGSPGVALTPGRRGELAAAAAGLRTVTEEQVQQALMGTLAPETIPKPAGEGAPRPVIPSHVGGELEGLDLRVYPAQSLDAQQAKLVLGEDGRSLQWEAANKKTRCSTLPEWERGFCHVLRKVKSDRQHRLMVYFKDWFQHKAMEYGVTPLIKFYEYLILQMEEDPSVTFERRCYSELFEDYSREQQLRPVRAKTPWRDDRSPRGGKQGEQKGKGGKARNDPPNPPREGGGKGGKGGKGRGRGGVELPQSPAQAAAPGNANSSRRAPAGAGEAPARGPVSGEGHEPEDGDEEEDVMSVANAFEFTPAEPGEGDYIEIERGGGDAGDILHGGDWMDGHDEHIRGGAGSGVRDGPETWSVMDGASRRLRRSKKWPAIREKLLRRATQERMEATGTMEHERARYVQEVQSVGAAVPLLTERAHLMAAAFEDWHDVDFLVRGAACGIGWPSRPMEMDEPFHVPNYVGDKHMEAMECEIEKELLEARIFPADDRRPWGVSALGMVEKLRNGKVKYRPVWDYSRPCDVGVNARIELEKDKFSSVKDAYALLRPGYWMVKVDLDSAYRSVGVASQFWPAQCFEFGGVRYMDARAPFGNRALPGIFMRYTRAIVAWMQAQGIPCVGYLDDFFMVAATREEAEEMMMLLVELVSFLGFKVNSAKCEGPEQLMEFLGVELSTSGGVCTAAISKDRVDFVDLDTIEDVIRRYNGRKVVLFREEDFFATDLSGTKGMGGLMDERFFLHSWEDVRKMIQKPWFPFRKGVPESEHISYLELFAVWWAVVLWGRHVQGRTVVIRINNQCALRQVAKWWGPPEYLPLLKQLFLTCVRYDIRLRPVYITTKDNKLADLLSRMQLRQFHMEHCAFMRATVWRQDRDDWMLSPAEFHSLDMEFGPFTLDACVAPSRANAFCAVSWSREEDARVQRCDGHQAWGNLPFSIMYDIIVNFLRCKKRQQMGTSGTFLVPVWGQDRGRAPDPTWTLILSMPEVFKVVREWRKGTHLFTAPALRGGGRSEWGPTRWNVVVVRVGPEPVTLPGWV